MANKIARRRVFTLLDELGKDVDAAINSEEVDKS